MHAITESLKADEYFFDMSRMSIGEPAREQLLRAMQLQSEERVSCQEAIRILTEEIQNLDYQEMLDQRGASIADLIVHVL